MKCAESTEKREDDGNEPGAGAGGRVGGCPKTTRALLQLPSRYGCAPKYGGGGEDGASSMEDARINTSEETVSMQDGGQRGVPGDSNRRDGEVGPRCAAQHGTI